MIDMKTLRFTLTLFLTGLGVSSMAQNSATPPKSYTDKLMPDVEIGTLMCKDDHGKYIKCNGDEFDQIAGFVTNSPYITLNKKDPKDTEPGFLAIPDGDVEVGDYIQASGNRLIRKCEQAEAYAKVIALAGDKVRVRRLCKN